MKIKFKKKKILIHLTKKKMNNVNKIKFIN
jgi:hypothetical protein